MRYYEKFRKRFKNNSMKYISPFHKLPESVLPQNLSSLKEIKMMQKLLLAEIELSTTQSIFIGETEMTKFDVLTLLDNLKKDNILEIHLAIYAEKKLLNFLENDIFPDDFSFLENPKLNSSTAIELISPYYKELIFKILSEAFSQKDVKVFHLFFTNKHLLTSRDSAEISIKLHYFFKDIENELIALIKQISDPKFKIQKNKIMEQVKALKIKENTLILNILPDEFSATRNSIATLYNNLSANLKHHLYVLAAEYVATNAQDIICDENIKKYLALNLKESAELSKSAKSTWLNVATLGLTMLLSAIINNVIYPNIKTKNDAETHIAKDSSKKATPQTSKTMKYDSAYQKRK